MKTKAVTRTSSRALQSLASACIRIIAIPAVFSATLLAVWSPVKAEVVVAQTVAPREVAALEDDTLDKIRRTGSITIGYRPQAFPFSYEDKNGQPVGYAIDLCREMLNGLAAAQHLPPVTIKYVTTTLITRFDDLNKNKMDMECSSTANDTKGQRIAGFILPFFVSSVHMLVPKSSAIRDYPDLRNKKIIVTENTPAFFTFTERNRIRQLNTTVITAKSTNIDAYHMLKEGKVDAWVMNDMLIKGLISNDKDADQYELRGKALVTTYVSPMVRLDDVAFRRAMDDQMATMMKSGRFEAIYDHWFTQTLDDGRNLHLPMGHALRELIRFPVSPMPY